MSNFWWGIREGEGASQLGSLIKNPPANAEDPGSIPVSGRYPGEKNGNPLQYSCLENTVGRGTEQATVHVVTKSWTGLSGFKVYY